MTLSGMCLKWLLRIVKKVLIPILMDDPLGGGEVSIPGPVRPGLNPYSNGWPSRGQVQKVNAEEMTAS